MCSYMSSDITQTCGWRMRTSVSALSSSHEYPAPVGFEGELKISHLVLGVIAASSAAG